MKKEFIQKALLSLGLASGCVVMADDPGFQPPGRIDVPRPVQQAPVYQAPIAPPVFQGGGNYFYTPTQNPGTFQTMPMKVQENPAYQTMNSTYCIEDRYGNTVITQQVMQDGVTRVPVHQGGRF